MRVKTFSEEVSALVQFSGEQPINKHVTGIKLGEKEESLGDAMLEPLSSPGSRDSMHEFPHIVESL